MKKLKKEEGHNKMKSDDTVDIGMAPCLLLFYLILFDVIII